MQNSTRVDIFEAAQNLVEEKLDVLVTERLMRLDNLGQVGFHQVRNHIQFVESFETWRLQDHFNSQHVFMVEQTHYFEFSQRAQRENLVLKGLLYFLDGYQVVLCVVRGVPSCHDHSIGALTDRVNNFVLFGERETRSEDNPGALA